MAVYNSVSGCGKARKKPVNKSAGGTSAEDLSISLPELGYALDSIEYGICVIGNDSGIKYINRALADITGIKPEKAANKQLRQAFHQPLCDAFNCLLKRIRDGEDKALAEAEIADGNGSGRLYNITAVPLRSRKGEIDGIIATFRGTEQADVQARESKDWHQALIDIGINTGEAIVIARDIDGKLGVPAYISEQWPRITGYSREELMQMSFSELVSPKDRQASKERYIKKRRGEKLPEHIELSIVRKDGAEVPIELTGGYTMYNGKKADVAYIRDITNRKKTYEAIAQSEKRYHDLFDNIPVAIMELDYSLVKKRFDEVRASGVTELGKYCMENMDFALECDSLVNPGANNPAICNLWGADNTLQFGRWLRKMHREHPEINSYLYAIAGLAEGKNNFGFEEFVPTMKGEWKNLLVQVSVPPGYEDDLSRVYLCFFDISDRKKAEDELKAYKDSLEEIINDRTSQLSKEVDQRKHAEETLKKMYKSEKKLRREIEKQMNQRIEFTRTLVHELKTPLTPLIATSDYLVRSAVGSGISTHVKNMNRGALNLSKRIDELLDMAKGELGVLSIRPELFDLCKLMRETAEYVSVEAADNRQEVLLELLGQPCRIWADRERIQQVLLNLLDNALKFTRKGGKVVLKASSSPDEITVQVQDSGRGIDREQQLLLFEPYKRLVQDKEHVGGLGLGLALCKILVELHEGRIWVESSKGKGSTFSFSLPFKTGAAE